MCWLLHWLFAVASEVSVAGCLGYDVLVRRAVLTRHQALFQLLVV